MAKKAAKRRVAKAIKINCKGSGLCELKKLKVIQGELKTLSPENEAKLRDRIEKYGFDAPFFVWKNKILDGTQRKIVLEKMIADGWTLPGDKVPVCEIKAKNLNDAKQRLLGYVSQYGKLDASGLDVFLKGIEVPDLGTIDLPDFDFEKFINPPKEGLTDPDAVPDPPKKPKTKPGDLYLLGEHRLLCSDASNSAEVGRLMQGVKGFLMVTDPPYGVEYNAGWRHEAGVNKSCKTGKVANDNRASWAAVFSRFDCDVAYVWHAGKNAGDVERSLIVSGFEIRSQIIWVKRRFALSRGHYHWRHEPCFYAVRKGSKANWKGGRKKDTVWADIVDSFPVDDSFVVPIDEISLYAFEGERSTVWDIKNDIGTVGNHSTQKPVECMARPIRNNSDPRDVVIDPFLGSGTTIIAAEMLDRRCFGMEIDPGYCDVIVKRWEDFTGKKAKRVRGKRG